MSVTELKKWQENNVLMGTVFFCLAFLIYSNTLNNEFAGDDPLVVSKNQYVQKGFGGIKDIFTTTLTEEYTGVKDFGYRPVPLAMFAIEKDIIEENSIGHHWMQVLLYGLSCVITFLILQRMLKSLGQWPIITATLRFIVHPIHTEVVANIKSRDEILGFIGVIGTTMSERLLFTPSFGFCLIASLIFFYMSDKSPLLLKRTINIALIIILIVFGLNSHSRNRDWKNDSVLIPKTYETSPKSGRVQSLMGSHYYNLAHQTPSDKAKKDYLQHSIHHFLKSIEIYNQNKFAFYELGFTYKEAEDYDRAVDAFLKFCELDSTNYRAWLQLGICYSKIEQYDKALQAYNHAESLNGDLPIILYNTGYTYRKLNQYDRAVTYFNKVLKKIRKISMC